MEYSQNISYSLWNIPRESSVAQSNESSWICFWYRCHNSRSANCSPTQYWNWRNRSMTIPRLYWVLYLGLAEIWRWLRHEFSANDRCCYVHLNQFERIRNRRRVLLLKRSLDIFSKCVVFKAGMTFLDKPTPNLFLLFVNVLDGQFFLYWWLMVWMLHTVVFQFRIKCNDVKVWVDVKHVVFEVLSFSIHSCNSELLSIQFLNHLNHIVSTFVIKRSK